AHPASADFQAEADRLAGHMGLRGRPRVYLLPGPVPPLLWAFLGRARLFFPKALLARLSERGRSALLVHELAHLARRDHWVRWVELLVAALFWWYPVAWLARRRLHAAEEECCDAWVLRQLPDAGSDYAGALLETVDFLSGARAALPPAASGF